MRAVVVACPEPACGELVEPVELVEVIACDEVAELVAIDEEGYAPQSAERSRGIDFSQESMPEKVLPYDETERIKKTLFEPPAFTMPAILPSAFVLRSKISGAPARSAWETLEVAFAL